MAISTDEQESFSQHVRFDENRGNEPFAAVSLWRLRAPRGRRSLIFILAPCLCAKLGRLYCLLHLLACRVDSDWATGRTHGASSPSMPSTLAAAVAHRSSTGTAGLILGFRFTLRRAAGKWSGSHHVQSRPQRHFMADVDACFHDFVCSLYSSAAQARGPKVLDSATLTMHPAACPESCVFVAPTVAPAG